MLAICFIILVLVSVGAYYITGRDPLFLLIELMVHLRAAIICAQRTARRAWDFYRANFSLAVEDVRRDARMRA